MGKNNTAHSFAEASSHVKYQHKNADGWVTLAKKLNNGSFKQYHYKAEEISSVLSEWLGEDVYFSQNTFYKPERKIENVRQLRALYVDVDSYLLNYDPEWVIGKLDLEVFGETLPNPNLIVHSGRGLVILWSIEPVPYAAMPLWKAVEDHFVKQLDYVGADARATDAARVFRIAGTVNSNNQATVTVQYRHDYRYILRELQQEYLPDLDRVHKKKGRKPKILRIHAVRTLHHARLLDLITLVELREYKVTGYREVICFLYRYWLSCHLDDPADALQHTIELNNSFSTPLPEHEVIRATLSAETAWKARSDKKANELAIQKGYPGAGYNLKNSTIIEWLDITPEEQTHLKTIIGAPEKRNRKRKRDKMYQEEKRREKGVQTRDEYIKKQQDKTDDKVFQLQELLIHNPNATRSELAQALNVHPTYITKLKKKL